MFFIVNTTKRSLSIGDLKIVLGPRQGIDLDRKYSRKQIEDSKGLKNLISQGIIVIKNKTIEDAKTTNIQNIYNQSVDLNSIKKEIIDGVKEALQKDNQIENPSTNNINMQELANIIASMVNNSNNNINTSQDKEIDIDDDVLRNIHTKVVDKMIKNVDKKNIEYDKTNVENDINSHIDELENLLG